MNKLYYWSHIMSDNKKQEKDYTPEVEALLPEAESLAQVRPTSLFQVRSFRLMKVVAVRKAPGGS
mgnify:FL=1